VTRLQIMILAVAAAILFAIAARAEEHDRHAPPPVPSTAPAASGTVNLNDANEEQLELLPGVGPTKAARIVEHRHAHPFKKVDELTKVKGIGRKSFARLRPYITLTGPTTLKTKPKLK
jgi:competence protein ComEA